MDSSVIVSVPKPKGKVNKDRPINTLLEYQVRHFIEVEKSHIPVHRTGLAVDPANMTEGEAAKYIKRMTAKLHELGKKPKRKRTAKPKANQARKANTA